MDLFADLNPQQRKAVEASDGPVLVLAGPGSGKTRVLTHRVAYLVQARGIAPRNILAVTFTNKAAREMRDRLEKLLGVNEAKELTLGTFHAICARFLRREAPLVGLSREFAIYDDDDQLALVKRTLQDLNLDDKKYRPTAMQNKISQAKSELVTPDQFQPHTYADEIARRVYERYQQLLRENNALDFDDLLMQMVILFDQNSTVLRHYQNRYEHVLVDEFQDTNTAQYALVRQLAGTRRNVFCVGDEDQCLPTGTLIQTPHGPKSIEKIRAGEQILAASGRGASMFARVSHVESRPHHGEVIRVTTRQGYSFRATPNHVIFARLGISPNVHLVYLMYQANLGYRIGVTVGARSDGAAPEPKTGLLVRGNQEQADRVWILRTCSTRDEAYYWESFYAFEYGIPTTVFFVRGRRMRMSQVAIDRLYQAVDTCEHAERLLADLQMDVRFPHYIPKA
ncbi:MAG TPA: UvrD-helicase domain-containing protein, partial [Anaerolineae bacterium]